MAFFLLHPSHRDTWYSLSKHLLYREDSLHFKKRTEKSRICIYSINAPYQNSDLYVVFYVIFSMLCLRYVYMQTHVLFMSKNKDD